MSRERRCFKLNKTLGHKKKWHGNQVFERVQGASPVNIAGSRHECMEEDGF